LKGLPQGSQSPIVQKGNFVKEKRARSKNVKTWEVLKGETLVRKENERFKVEKGKEKSPIKKRGRKETRVGKK